MSPQCYFFRTLGIGSGRVFLAMSQDFWLLTRISPVKHIAVTVYVWKVKHCGTSGKTFVLENSEQRNSEPLRSHILVLARISPIWFRKVGGGDEKEALLGH